MNELTISEKNEYFNNFILKILKEKKPIFNTTYRIAITGFKLTDDFVDDISFIESDTFKIYDKKYQDMKLIKSKLKNTTKEISSATETKDRRYDEKYIEYILNLIYLMGYTKCNYIYRYDFPLIIYAQNGKSGILGVVAVYIKYREEMK